MTLTALAERVEGLPDAEMDDDGSVTLMWRMGDRTLAIGTTQSGALNFVISPYDASFPPLQMNVADLFRALANQEKG